MTDTAGKDFHFGLSVSILQRSTNLSEDIEVYGSFKAMQRMKYQDE